MRPGRYSSGKMKFGFAPEHNAAFACERGADLVIMGGRTRFSKSDGTTHIVERAIAPLHGWEPPAPLLWSRTAPLTLEGFHCASHCYLDGKLALARAPGGHHLLYVRANMASPRGGRHVQVARSPDGVGNWSRLELLRFDGYRLRSENNIYLTTVRTVRFAGRPRDSRALLLGLFPAAIEGRGGLYAAVSLDGVAWTAPRRLLNSRVLTDWRTQDHPVEQQSEVAHVHPHSTNASVRLTVVVQRNVAMPAAMPSLGIPESEAWADGWPFVEDFCDGSDAATRPRFCQHSLELRFWRRGAALEPRRDGGRPLYVQLGNLKPWTLYT